MARLVLVKIGVDVIQFDEPAFNVYVYGTAIPTAIGARVPMPLAPRLARRKPLDLLTRLAPVHLGIGRAVLVNVSDAGLGSHVDVRVRRAFARDSRANFQHHYVRGSAVLETVPIGITAPEAGAVTGAQHLLAGIGRQHNLAREHVDELVFLGMPVPLA